MPPAVQIDGHRAPGAPHEEVQEHQEDDLQDREDEGGHSGPPELEDRAADGDAIAVLQPCLGHRLIVDQRAVRGPQVDHHEVRALPADRGGPTPYIQIIDAGDGVRTIGTEGELPVEQRARAMLPRCDVVHIHWPEGLLETSSRARAAFAAGQQLALIDWARWRGARLPSEAEWERAALDEDSHGRLEQLDFGPGPAGPFVGDCWEWTGTEFDGYPGFHPHPYPEYSQVFFGSGYRVLRGASWATRSRVARRTFRNWDQPQRRQIFAGFRCAEDA